MPNLKEFSVEVDGNLISGLSVGEKNNSPILFLHGWLDNAASFASLLPFLDDNYCIAIDWPGHGHSAHRGDDAHYHFFDYVYDLLSLIETQQWQSVTIVAHSMGGMVASAFSAAFPEKVKRLVLIDTLGFICQEEEKTTQQLRKGMETRRVQQVKRKPIHVDLDSAINARMQVSDLQYSEAKLLCERGLEGIEGGFTWRADSRLRNVSPYRLTFGQAKQLISDIRAPCLHIYGDKGLDMVNQGRVAFLRFYQNLTEYSLSGGHHVHMEQPEESAKLIRLFINSAN